MNWRDEAVSWATERMPNEACGLVVIHKGRERFIGCENQAIGTDHFIISAEDYADAEDIGDVVGIFHSHPNSNPEPSQADLVSCERSGLEWHIVSLPSVRWHSFRPSGYEAPLIGREFSHGVSDCYAIIRDWYKINRGVLLGDYERHDHWWNRGQNLYLDNYQAEGFIETDELHEGALLFMQIESPVPNHAAIYLGDNMILHHLQGRLSSRDIYSEYYRKHTVRILRYAGKGNQTIR